MPRIVRKSQQSYSSRLVDLLVAFSEDVSLVDWDQLSRRWIGLAGLLINLFFWALRAQADHISKTAVESVFDSHPASKLGRSGSVRNGWTSKLVLLASTLCVVGSVFNTWYCFSRKRGYQLAPQSSGRPHLSTSDEKPAAGFSTPIQAARSIFTGATKGVRSEHADRPIVSIPANEDESRTVRMWDPSMVSLRIFSVFSPAHVLLTWSYSSRPANWIVLLLLSLQSLYLIEIFCQHVLDKKLIYGQVFSEYEKNFVEPRLSIMKRDVGVGTRADDNGVYVEVHTPKVGIIDARTAKTMPKSASQIRMHEWDIDSSIRDFPASPNVWAQQSPLKRSQSNHLIPTSRLSVASPIKAADGSPAKMYKPAGWSSSSGLQQGTHSISNLHKQAGEATIRRSRTSHSLGTKWD